MNRFITTIMFADLLLVSCDRGYKDSFVSEVNIDLTQEDCKPIESMIKNISVVEFAIDDSWKYVSVPLMAKTDSSFVLCDADYYHLLIYDLNGNKMTDRHIKGRGRGEVLRVSSMFLNDESICIYDGGMGNLLYFDGDGLYKSKWKAEVHDDFLYGIDNHYAGLYSYRSEGNNYVSVYNEQGNTVNKFFTLPKYLRDNPLSFGQTPNSYIFKDTLRFYLPFDYNIFSVTNNSFVSTYKFIPEKPIPSTSLTDEDAADGSDKLLSMVLSEGYDAMFQCVFETDRYLYFVYFSKGRYKNCLFDKVENNLYKNDYPNEYFNKKKVSEMSAADVWQYLIYGFMPLYADGNDLYVQLSFDGYQMLKDCAEKLDNRMSSLLDNMEQYITNNKLAIDEVIIIKVSFVD